MQICGMAVASTAPFRRPDGLAVAPAAVVRSGAMSIDTEAKLLRAKNRLYVLCQLAGWGAFMGMQLFYQNAAENRAGNRSRDQAITIMVTFRDRA